jgi:hypothetical protein
MPCFSEDEVPDDYLEKGSGSFDTEEECLEACAEGACCKADGRCIITAKCECDTDAGDYFIGVGETCNRDCAGFLSGVSSQSNPLP